VIRADTQTCDRMMRSKTSPPSSPHVGAEPLFAVAALLMVLGVGACGNTSAVATSTPVASSTTAPAGSPSASPSSDPTTRWSTFASAKWGYSIKYPKDWLDLPNFGAPDNEKYFANENVGGPDYMGASGIFFNISVYPLPGNVGLGQPQNADQCLQHGIRGITVERQAPVNVDGVSASMNSFALQGSPMIAVNLMHGGTCYWFTYIFHSTQLRDVTESVAQTMLGQTFKFGT
jgi:hypothetical protein